MTDAEVFATARRIAEALERIADALERQADEVVHLAPWPGEALTRCCKETVFELPRTDRITMHTARVTCKGRE